MSSVQRASTSSGGVKGLTASFIVLESVLLYYWVGLMQSDFKILPGIYQILKTYFPVFPAWYDLWFVTTRPLLWMHYQFFGGFHLLVAITISLSVLVPLVAYLYWRKVSRYNNIRRNFIVSSALFATVYGMLLYSITQAISFIFFPPLPALPWLSKYDYSGYVYTPLSVSYFIYQQGGPPLGPGLNNAGMVILKLEYLIAVLAVLLAITVIVHLVTVRKLLKRPKVARTISTQ